MITALVRNIKYGRKHNQEHNIHPLISDLPVKLGGITTSGTYDYIILSQPLKFPTMVLTRNADKFNTKYKLEVSQFLEKYGFLSPIAALNTRLSNVNTSRCLLEYNSY